MVDSSNTTRIISNYQETITSFDDLKLKDDIQQCLYSKILHFRNKYLFRKWLCISFFYSIQSDPPTSPRQRYNSSRSSGKWQNSRFFDPSSSENSSQCQKAPSLNSRSDKRTCFSNKGPDC